MTTYRRVAVAAEFVGAQPPQAVEKFLDSLLPSEADALVKQGDEASLRQALELEPRRADTIVPLARILHARGESDEALELLGRLGGSFAADALAARITLEQSDGQPELDEAFKALDNGDQQRALDLMLEALSTADGTKDDIRRVIVGVLDDLGVEHPLSRDYRRRLAAALY